MHDENHREEMVNSISARARPCSRRPVAKVSLDIGMTFHKLFGNFPAIKYELKRA